jgi:hypothetical protein
LVAVDLGATDIPDHPLLEQLTVYQSRRMELLPVVLKELQVGEYGASMDLTDAYLQVPVQALDRK